MHASALEINDGSYFIYDDPEIQREFVEHPESGLAEVSLSLDGINCSACCYKIEKKLASSTGVKSIQVNYSTSMAEIIWIEGQIKLSDILKQIEDLGFKAWPFHHNGLTNIHQSEQREQLLRIGCAALFGMQVMMISIGIYIGTWQYIDPQLHQFLRWVLLILTLPVISFSARPFYKNALRDLKHRSLSMDLPVALGISIAMLGSIHSILTNTGEVYFDSICMLTLFLLCSRYLELRTRLASNRHIEKLYRVIPTMATLVKNDMTHETIAAVKLQKDDVILVKPGEVIPVDGYIIEGSSSVNEAILTGESLPQNKNEQGTVIAGSTNIESPLFIKVTSTGKQTRLGQIIRLVEKGNLQKPKIARLINRVAGWFILSVLSLATITAIFWYFYSPSNWLAVTVSVLVVTCPCALSLATPTAYTAACNFILSRGMALLGTNVLQTLASATTFIFDKTGTLTTGQPQIIQVTPVHDLSEEYCLLLAASIEQASEHPLAEAFRQANTTELLQAEELENHPGLGIRAKIDGINYFLGNDRLIRDKLTDTKISKLSEHDGTKIFLADDKQVLCEFILTDKLRPDAASLVSYLKQQGKSVHLISGDNNQSVSHTADLLGIDYFTANQLPEEKIQSVENLLSSGHKIVMVGDGVNDAPALSNAHLSIAMGSGADISKLNADLILLDDKLEEISLLIKVAERYMKILKQNIGWAILYNLFALPVAMLGLLTPWQAAIGMSVSSLIVVINSTRLQKIPD